MKLEEGFPGDCTEGIGDILEVIAAYLQVAGPKE